MKFHVITIAVGIIIVNPLLFMGHVIYVVSLPRYKMPLPMVWLPVIVIELM